jgi:hypothetical protein
MKKMVGTIGTLATAGWIVFSVGYFERFTDRRLSKRSRNCQALRARPQSWLYPKAIMFLTSAVDAADGFGFSS